MITEQLIKNEITNLTGKIRLTKRKGNFKKAVSVYLLEIEINTKNGKKFFFLHTQRGEHREFSTMNAVEKFLIKANLIELDTDINAILTVKTEK